jgi:hypothetical protein
MTEYVRARVTGRLPIRDAVTRESVPYGGEVRLLARQPHTSSELCARHPKPGGDQPKQPCTCGTTVIDLLVSAGAVELIADKPKGKA